MINKVGQIMLYVHDQDKAVKFWTEKLGFSIISEEVIREGIKSIEVAPSKDSETSIVLQNKGFIAKMEPEMNLGTPSLMFFTNNLNELYIELSNKNVTLGEIVTMPQGKVFNFADYEDNYFAVMEKSR